MQVVNKGLKVDLKACSPDEFRVMYAGIELMANGYAVIANMSYEDFCQQLNNLAPQPRVDFLKQLALPTHGLPPKPLFEAKKKFMCQQANKCTNVLAQMEPVLLELMNPVESS